jgi:S-adenosylmethionine uptake transporter
MRLAPSPIIVAAAAIFLGCAMDAVIKHVSATASPLTISFARFGFGAITAGAMFVAARAPPIPRSALKIHAARAVMIVIAAPLFIYALSVLPLTEAMTLGFTAPLIMPFLAAVTLKEKLRAVSLWAAAIGFAGVVIAAYSPSAQAATPERALGIAGVLVSVLAYCGSLILLRYRAASDSPYAIGLMGNLMPAALLAIPALALEPAPRAGDLPWLALIGVLGAVFWLMLTWSYARAAPQTLAPLEYTGLIWGAGWGFLVFHEPLQPRVLIGALFIVAACILVGWDERRANASPEITV